MKYIKPRHITNVEYQNFRRVYYYITYPGVKPKLYGINLFGDVISLVKNREKRRRQHQDQRGYKRVTLRCTDEKSRPFITSRLVAWEFVGHPENYNELQVNHADGLIQHNFYKNLEWTTPTENQVHKALYGLAASRENQGCNVHPEKVVRKVIKYMHKGWIAPKIARKIIDKYPDIYPDTKEEYDRLRGLVSKINRGVSWYKLKDEMEGSTTIESIIYEKHIGEEVSRVGLHPIAVPNSGRFIFGKRK